MFADARLVTAAALLIQVTGFAKTLLIAHLFGASAELDGYYLALVAPSLIVGVVGGSLQGSFVTAYVRLLKQDESLAETNVLRVKNGQQNKMLSLGSSLRVSVLQAKTGKLLRQIKKELSRLARTLKTELQVPVLLVLAIQLLEQVSKKNLTPSVM